MNSIIHLFKAILTLKDVYLYCSENQTLLFAFENSINMKLYIMNECDDIRVEICYHKL